LLKYGGTTDPVKAAALSHLLHSWTAAPQTQDQLAPTNDFRHIAYDVAFHLSVLPPNARAAVETLRREAVANHGPWTTTLVKPAKQQVVGVKDNWTVTVRGEAGNKVPAVPVRVKVTGGTLDPDTKLTTPADGTLVLPVTPTAAKTTVSIEVDSPAERPIVQQAVQADTQRIVSTGGQQKTTKTEETTANTPGQVKITKVNEATGTAIPGVPLRLTAADRTSPAVDVAGKPLVGTDGKPTVLITGSDGIASVANLKTPQEICVVEVAPARGFEERFDPAAPPFACGKVEAGDTLTLTVANKPNLPNVPIKVPAGDRPVAAGYAPVVHLRPLWAMVTVGALVLIGAGLLGFGIRRRITSRR
jgi:hypothetical protein